MISIFEAMSLVFKNMVEKKSRVFLTIFGIIIGIFTFTFFIFVSQGLTNTITNQFSSFGVNVLAVQQAGGFGDPSSFSGLTDTEVSKIRQVARNFDYISPSISARLQYEYGQFKSQTVTVSYPDENLGDIERDLGFEVEFGRFIRPGDRNAVVLGAKFAKDAFGEREVKVGNSIKVGDKNLRVVGIFKERGDLFVDNSVFMPFSTIKELSGRDTYSVIRVVFEEGADLEFNRKAIDNRLNPGNQKLFEITSPQDAIDTFNNILGLLTAIISFVASIALIVGGINVMNTMYSNVLERINEISVMKALGATNQDIRNLFLIESAILGFIGALIGFILAFGLAKLLGIAALSFGYDVPINFDFYLFSIVILVTMFFSILFGTYPAILAAKTNPAENLRDE